MKLLVVFVVGLAIGAGVLFGASEFYRDREEPVAETVLPKYLDGEASALVNTYLAGIDQCMALVTRRGGSGFEEEETQPGVWKVTVSTSRGTGVFQVFEGTGAVMVLIPIYDGIC
jgi:hypothetical protein